MQKIIGIAATSTLKLDPTQNQELVCRDQRTRKRCNLLLPLAVVATLCFNAPTRADDQVPFKGTFIPIVLSSTNLDATHIRFEADVIVRATQLGDARGPAYFILDLATLSYVGAATWVAANGDAIFTTFAGQFVPTDTPGLLDNVETGPILGGTGRFEGATGTLVAGGQFDAITQSVPAPIPFEGTISSPGSLKR